MVTMIVTDYILLLCVMVPTAAVFIQTYIIECRIGGDCPHPFRAMSWPTRVIWVAVWVCIIFICIAALPHIPGPFGSSIDLMVLFSTTMLWWSLAIVYADVRSGKWKASREQ